MRWSILQLAFASVILAGKDVCQQQPYEAFLPLSKLGQAESFCASNYPLVPCMSKITRTSLETVTEIVATTTITQHFVTGEAIAVARSTVISTQISTSVARTVTITISPSTVTSTVYTATSTSVLFSSDLLRRQSTVKRRQTLRGNVGSAVKRHHDNAQIPIIIKPSTTASTAATTTAPPAMLKSLFAQAGNFISTICSCIQDSQECTTTMLGVTETVTNRVTATSTCYDITITKPSTSTMLYTATVTSTVTVDFTTTLLLPEPTAIATETVSLATTTTQYCPASCTSGAGMRACAPHRPEAETECASFSIQCNTVISTLDQVPAKIIPAASHGECMRACDFLDGCNVFTYRDGRGTCMMYQNMNVREVQTTSATGGSTGWRPIQKACEAS